MPEFIELQPAEKSREYHFCDGSQVRFDDVRRIAVSDSGTHRIETGDGLKHIVPPRWIKITIDVAGWTF